MEQDLKQKQIEEMAKDMLGYGMEKYPTGESVFTETKLREQFYHVFLTYAEYLINKNYRKIPENAVVLTREELKEKYVSKNLYQLLQKVSISRREQLIKRDEAFMRVRKETVEKFAEMAKERKIEMGTDGHSYCMVFEDDIDEIAKEITEGKV